MLPNLAVKAIQDPCHFIQPHLQIHLPSSHNDQRALPSATHHVFAHMVVSTWNEAPSLAISTFRSLTQLPRFRSKATSCGKPFSDPFLMHVPLPLPSYSNHLLAHLLLHLSLNQFHFQAHSLQASLPHRRQWWEGTGQVTINSQLLTRPKGLDITDAQ